MDATGHSLERETLNPPKSGMRSRGWGKGERDQVAAEFANLTLHLRLAALFLGKALSFKTRLALCPLFRELLVFLAAPVDVELHIPDFRKRLC